MSTSVISVLRSLGTEEIAPPPAAAWPSLAPQIVSEQCTRADDNVLQCNGPTSSPEDAFIFPSLVRPPGAKAYGSDFAADHCNSQTQQIVKAMNNGVGKGRECESQLYMLQCDGLTMCQWLS